MQRALKGLVLPHPVHSHLAMTRRYSISTGGARQILNSVHTRLAENYLMHLVCTTCMETFQSGWKIAHTIIMRGNPKALNRTAALGSSRIALGASFVAAHGSIVQKLLARLSVTGGHMINPPLEQGLGSHEVYRNSTYFLFIRKPWKAAIFSPRLQHSFSGVYSMTR